MRHRQGQVAGGVVMVLVVLVTGGCGGSHRSAPAAAVLPHALGVRLADEASLIETSLTQGHTCTAVRQARQLRAAVGIARAAGQVPQTLLGPLSRSVVSLVGQIRCSPPAKSSRPHKHGHPHQNKGNGDGNGNGNGNGDGNGNGGDGGRD